MMKYLQWIVLGWICLSPSLYAVTINTTNVPDYPQPPVPNLVEASTPAPDAREQETTRTLNPAPVEHTVYPTVIDEPPEYEDSETVAFPPENKNRAAADSSVVAASITLTCNPVEYGTPVTTTETVPVIAIIAAFDPPFAVKTNKTVKILKQPMRWDGWHLIRGSRTI